MPAEKILVIDDDKTIREMLQDILERHGLSTICAANGQDGLKDAIRETPDAIILDRIMPGMDGNEVLQLLKQNDKTKHIPVMILTGKQSSQDISSSLQLGATDYIVKPFDEGNLIVRIKNLLKKQALRA